MAIMPGAPPAAPVSPPNPAGLEAMARKAVMQARRILENAVPVLGAASDDGKKVITALRALGDVTGESEDSSLATASAAPPPMGLPMMGPTPGPGSMVPGRPMAGPGGF